MDRALAVLWALTISASPAIAGVGTIRQAPPRTSDEYPRSIYVGNYGETLEIPGGWAAEAEMHGEAEVVRFHRAYKDLLKLHPYDVKGSDYKPENFTKMGLIQVIVIPKTAPGGFHDLAAMRRAKEADLRKESVEYGLKDADVNNAFWTPPAFDVVVTRPYRLAQTYAQSRSELFILTTGYDFRAKDYGFTRDEIAELEDAADTVTRSLSDDLAKVQSPTKRPPEDDVLFFVRNANPRFLAGVCVFLGLMLLLAVWPGEIERREKFRRFAISMLVFLPGSAALGFMAVALPPLLGRPGWNNYGTPSALAILFLPPLAYVLARRLRCAKPTRVLAWASLAATPLFLACVWEHFQGPCNLAIQGFAGTLYPFLAGGIVAVAFFLACASTTGDGIKLGLGIVVLVLLSTTSQAAELNGIDLMQAHLDPERTAIEAARRIQERAPHPDYRAEAAKRLRRRGELFDIQRMEITGVDSNDDSARTDTKLFDRQVKPSFTSDQGANPLTAFAGTVARAGLGLAIPGLLNSRDLVGLDLIEVRAAMRGELTTRGKRVLEEYKNKEMNEIVAHSWGTELIYAAILNGYIKPPKRLFVTGVPDDNYDKWALLAEKTGTQLYFVRADNDHVANTGVRLNKLFASSIDFAARWGSFCRDTATRMNCPAHDRAPKEPIKVDIGPLPDVSGHERFGYYNALKSKSLLTRGIEDLRRDGTVAIESESEIVKQDEWNDSYAEAQRLVKNAQAEWRSAEIDENARMARIQRCREDGQKIIGDSCSGRSMSADDYIAYRESQACEQDAARGGRWITQSTPMPLVGFSGGCTGQLAAYLSRASKLDPGYAATYVGHFFDEGRRCSGAAYDAVVAACNGRTFTDADVTSFYRNLDCAKSRMSREEWGRYATTGRCAYELRHELDEHFSTVEQANELADYYRQKFAPPPPAPPPPPARPPVYHRPPREEEPIDPPEKKCHMEYMGECCGGWVRICPG